MRYGDTEEQRSASQLIFEEIITAAAVACGFQKENVIRADISSVNRGSLNKNIFHELATADLVIADLSGNSRSVYYELGVRHALRANRTLTIMLDGEDAAFAIKNDQNIFRYRNPTSLEEFRSEKKKLADRITQKLQAKKGENDSPVFEFNPLLLEYIDREPSDDVHKIAELRLEIERLTAENAELKEKCGARNSSASRRLLDFDEAEKEQETYGDVICEKLRRSVYAGDVSGFKELIRQIQNNQMIDEDDFIVVANLCDELDLRSYNRMVLEYANEMYPSHNEIFINLMSAYCNSPSKDKRERARDELESSLYIDRDGNGDNPICTEKTKTSTIDIQRALLVLFEVYISMGAYPDLLSLCESIVPGELGVDKTRVDLNRAIANKNLGHNAVALEAMLEAFKSAPGVGTLLAIGDLLYKTGDHKRGFLVYELLTTMRHDEAYSFIRLATRIFQYDFLRDQDNELIDTRLDDRLSKRFSIPLLFKALEKSSTEDDIYTVVSRLRRMRDNTALDYLLSANNYDLLFEEFRTEHPSYGYSEVDYLDKEIENYSGNESRYLDEKIVQILNINLYSSEGDGGSD